MSLLRDLLTTPGKEQRMGRGDVRAAIMSLLAERPMHGYQMINEIQERSGGAWRPSPGSVYPTLQLLADEGLVVADNGGERKVYSLTEEGRRDAAAQRYPTEGSPIARAAERASALPKAGLKLAQAMSQFGSDATPEQVEAAVKVIEEARRKLFTILAGG